MNETLARLYGTQTKTASDETSDVDLSKLTGAQLMELLERVEGQEKTASEEELLKAMDENGALAFYDMAGRIQAHALHDELSKLAGAETSDEDEVIEVDLNQVTGEQLIGLLNEGYEFTTDDELEKDANRVTEALSRAGGKVWSGFKRGITAERLRAAIKAKPEDIQALSHQWEQAAGARGKKFRPPTRAKEIAKGIGETAAAAAPVAGAATGAALGARALLRKKKGKK